MFLQKKELTSIIVTVLCLLLIPLIAMQFTEEVNWKISDFIVMGFLLLLAGVLIKLSSNIVRKKNYRITIIVIIIILFLLIWAELAVGIFGTTLAGN